ISEALNGYHFVFLHTEIDAERVRGASLERISELMDTVDSDVLLIEADGARGRLMKAPYDHEPVIPSETTLVVPVVALDVLGKPLDDDHVYNAQGINNRYGFGIGNRIKSPWVAQVLRDEHLSLRGAPDRARLIALINQVPESGYLRGRARLIAQLALRDPSENRRRRHPTERRLNGVALGSVRALDPIHEVQRPVGAVVLAAGMSTRMGQMKVLLPWADDRTIIEHIVHQLNLARVDHIVVVTGNRGDEVKALVEPLGAVTAYNQDYQQGEMLSSMKTGLAAMPGYIAAAMVTLGDQPRIQPKTVSMVMAAYAEGRGNIVAPSYNMRRGHPILIDRRYWNDMLALPADGAPRDVINANKDHIAYVLVDNDSVLKDVDTPAAYQEERRKAGLD
ncbi:MAG: selenium cofactor biosynthesis protein YqeC, partial [Chloroflexota bacterium]